MDEVQCPGTWHFLCQRDAPGMISMIISGMIMLVFNVAALSSFLQIVVTSLKDIKSFYCTMKHQQCNFELLILVAQCIAWFYWR